MNSLRGRTFILMLVCRFAAASGCKHTEIGDRSNAGEVMAVGDAFSICVTGRAGILDDKNLNGMAQAESEALEELTLFMEAYGGPCSNESQFPQSAPELNLVDPVKTALTVQRVVTGFRVAVGRGGLTEAAKSAKVLNTLVKDSPEARTLVGRLKDVSLGKISEAISARWLSPKATKAWAFSWTDDPQLTTANAQQKVLNAFQRAREISPTMDKQARELKMGVGFYIAGDPISSSNYGRKLILAPLQKEIGNKVALFDDSLFQNVSESLRGWRQLVNNIKIPGIFYKFGGIPFARGGENAIVLRGEGVMDLSRVKVIDLSATYSRPWRELATKSPLKGDQTEEIVNTYLSNSTIFARYAKDEAIIFTKNPAQPISDYGILVGMRSELANANPKMMNTILKWKTDAATPKLRELLDSYAKEKGADIERNTANIMLDGIFNEIAKHLVHKTPFDHKTYEGIPIAELIHEVKALALIPADANPANVAELWTVMLKTWNREPSAYKNLTEGYRVVKAMKTYWEAHSFSSWAHFGQAF